MQPPVIVLPGITASTLRDEYPVTPDLVWSMLHKRYDRVMLHPDDLRYEGAEPARVRADQLYDFPYGGFIAELRHNLTDHEDQPVPVYPFAYDWRMPLDAVQAQLALFIDEVIARTSLMRHYHAAGYAGAPMVDLVAHSMGGLIIAGYLSTTRDRRVRRVATLGSPFRGSFEAVLKVATGTAAIGGAGQGSRDREAARLTPSLYHLVPSFDDGVIAVRPEWENLFEAASWQPGVIATIAEQIRLSGVAPPERDSDRARHAVALLQSMLHAAADHRATVESFDLRDAGMTAHDWLCVVGVGEKTRVALKVEEVDGAPFFRLDRDQRMNGYPDGTTGSDHSPPAAPWDTGDGTVPYAGARVPFLAAEHLVCVCDADFGYWEIRDRVLEGPLATLHGLLPSMNLVQRLVVAHLRGAKGRKAPSRPGVWGRRPPDLPVGTPWDPPVENLQDKTE